MEQSALLASLMTPCVILDKTTVSDGLGGYNEVYVEGAAFDAAIAINSTTEAQIAYQAGTKRLYTVATKQLVRLSPNMRIKRLHDGLILRVTSNSTDLMSPGMSELNLAQVSAEAIDV